MNDRSSTRAARLVRLYPRRWREQFPDFEGFLAAQLAEDHRGVYRNVVGAAVGERLRDIGAIPKTPAARARSGLALMYAALVPFAGLAVGMWSQLHTGMASTGAATPPHLRTPDRYLTVGALVVVAAVPLALVLLVAGARRVSGPETDTEPFHRQLLSPFLTLVGALVTLTAAGWGVARSGWYSPAAAALPNQGLGHLATLWVRGIIGAITPAWVHPTLFAQMPAGEVAAALLAPVAAIVAAGAAFLMIVRLPVRKPTLANALVAVATFVTMVVCVIGSGRWLIEHPTRQGPTAQQARFDQLAPGDTGWIVVSMLAALTLVAAVGLRRVLTDQAQARRSAVGT